MKGQLIAFVGCMFSGKTTQLVTLTKKAEKESRLFQCFKPKIDVRYAENGIVSHDKQSVKAQPVASAREILTFLERTTEIVIVDEIQFFDQSLIGVLQSLVWQGKVVYVAGLDTDWRGRPLGPVPEVLTIATQEYR